MNLNQTFTVLFWQTKSRTLNGLCMIYARVTINGKRIKISTNRKIHENLWNAKLQKAQGVSLEAKSLNIHFDTIES
jgi:integrase/recombinase XerD